MFSHGKGNKCFWSHYSSGLVLLLLFFTYITSFIAEFREFSPSADIIKREEKRLQLCGKEHRTICRKEQGRCGGSLYLEHIAEKRLGFKRLKKCLAAS